MCRLYFEVIIMFRIIGRDNVEGDQSFSYLEQGNDAVRININSNSNVGNAAPDHDIASNVDSFGNNRTSRSTLLPTRQSIFQPRPLGYGTAQLKAPVFDNDAFKYTYFKNRMHHYLLMLGIYPSIVDSEISETTDMDLYLAIASCLTDQSLDLVSTQAFGQGQKAYRLLDQKFLGNADAREAKTMIEITSITQKDHEDMVPFLDRFEVLKSRLDEFGTINKCSFYTILCIKGLHPKYETFKNIICAGKTPSWELFKEKLESHSAMMSLDKQKSGKVLNVTKFTPKIVKRGRGNFKKFVDSNSRKCLNCFGRSHTTKNCQSTKWCKNCSNASHNTVECRLKHQFTIQANQGNQNHPEQPRSGYPSNQRRTQPRGRGNRPHFASTRGGRGRFPKPNLQSVNTFHERVENTEFRENGNNYIAHNFQTEQNHEDRDLYPDSDNHENIIPNTHHPKGNMFL